MLQNQTSPIDNGRGPGRLRTGLLLALLGVLVWAVATWPLPLHFTTAVPHTERRVTGAPAVEELVPGDHIQLLYHFWLFRDMASGRTPPFTNVYEFNMGDDGARRKFDPYYIPFSAVYALVSPLLGHAAGWNAAGLFSVLLGIFGFYALSRRYTASRALATAAATVATGLNKVWECYVAGLNPTNAADVFRAVISMEDGGPVIGWEPKLSAAEGAKRTYTIFGRESLTDGSWGPTNSASRFFRVKVSMP